VSLRRSLHVGPFGPRPSLSSSMSAVILAVPMPHAYRPAGSTFPGRNSKDRDPTSAPSGLPPTRSCIAWIARRCWGRRPGRWRWARALRTGHRRFQVAGRRSSWPSACRRRLPPVGSMTVAGDYRCPATGSAVPRRQVSGPPALPLRFSSRCG